MLPNVSSHMIPCVSERLLQGRARSVRQWLGITGVMTSPITSRGQHTLFSPVAAADTGKIGLQIT